MAGQQLPSRIAGVMVGLVAAFVLTVGLTIGWMGRALDRQARDHATAQMTSARDSLLAQTRILMLDYAKWEAAVPWIQARDMAWIRDNIGASAVAGVSFQLAVLWGGPLAEDLGWSEGGPAEARGGVVDPALLGLVETRLRRIPLNLYRGTEFFAWHGGRLLAIGAARIEPDAPAAVADLVSFDARTPRILLAQEVTPEVVNRIAATLRLEGLELVRRPPADRSVLALPGGDGRPVAFLAWESPRPGNAVLRRMAPILAAELLLILGMAAFGGATLWRSAGRLVMDERAAFAAARTDPLTGLANRAALFEALARPAAAGERAILFLDLNGFKPINDSLGHAAGDEVIVELGRRLAGLRPQGSLLSRIGGDEFVILLTGPEAEARMRALIGGVQAAMDRPFEVLGRRVGVDGAIGYALQTRDDLPGEELLRQADLAMYRSKREGHGLAVFFQDQVEDLVA